jgi:hypothetical protein
MSGHSFQILIRSVIKTAQPYTQATCACSSQRTLQRHHIKTEALHNRLKFRSVPLRMGIAYLIPKIIGSKMENTRLLSLWLKRAFLRSIECLLPTMHLMLILFNLKCLEQ